MIKRAFIIYALTFFGLINMMRFIIVFDGYLKFDRFPTSKDAFDVFPYRYDIFNKSFDEGVLLVGHFFLPLFLLVGVFVSIYISYKNQWTKLYFPILMVLFFLFEIGIRNANLYGYLMWFD